MFENLFKTSGKSNIDTKARELLLKLPFYDRDHAVLQEELDIPFTMYYSIIKKLRGIGLISKRDGVWCYSDKFARRCEDMARVVRSMSINKGERVEGD